MQKGILKAIPSRAHLLVLFFNGIGGKNKQNLLFAKGRRNH